MCLYGDLDRNKQGHTPISNTSRTGFGHVHQEHGTPDELEAALEPELDDIEGSALEAGLPIDEQEANQPVHQSSGPDIGDPFNALDEAHSPMLSVGVDATRQPNVVTSCSNSHSPRAPVLYDHRPPSTTFSDNVEVATERWVNLLFRDAVTQNGDLWNMNFETKGLNIFGNSAVLSPVNPPQLDESNNQAQAAADSPASSNLGLLERNDSLDLDQVLEKQLWQSEAPIEILDQEHYAFRHFVQHISTWVCSGDILGPYSMATVLTTYRWIFSTRIRTLQFMYPILR